jgi:hypothetical protein
MVRDKKDPPLEEPDTKNASDLQAFGRSVRGLISYFDMSRDYTKFPRVQNSHVLKSPMSVKQFVKYAEAYHTEKPELKNMNTLMTENMSSAYYKHARRYSNMLYDFENDMMLNEFSTKLPRLLDIIQRHPKEKHYVYSAFYENRGYGGHGIIAISHSLERQLGYEKLTLTEANEMLRQGLSKYTKKPRYVLAVSSDLGDNRENLKTLVRVFNMSENSRGEYVSVFLASQGYNEGIDLKAVRHVHIFEPLLTYAADKQTIGRAARFCSHADLNRDQGEWVVKVHRYISDIPEDDLSQFNLNYLRDRMSYLMEWRDHLKERNAILPDKTVVYQSKKQKYKEQIKELDDMIKHLEKKSKEVAKVNVRNIEMIDKKVAREAMERTKSLLLLYDVMKKNAVDYLLLRDLHSNSLV